MSVVKEKGRKLSTADLRRETVLASAMQLFASTGYYGTTVADVAKHAGISSAYVFRLFPRKEELFVEAVKSCYRAITNAILAIAGFSAGRGSREVLEDIRVMYANLIGDQVLLMLQVQAQSVAAIPDIGAAIHWGLKSVVEAVEERSHAGPDEVQRMMAYGQLCHLIVTTGLERVDANWATVLTQGMLHP